MLPIILEIRDEEDRDFVTGIFEANNARLRKIARSITGSRENADRRVLYSRENEEGRRGRSC